jgi:phosphate transport system permease protein
MTTNTHSTAALAAAPSIRKVDLEQLDRSLRRPRTLVSFCLSVLCGILALLAALPLLSVLLMLIWRGGARLSLALFTDLPPAAGMQGGGIGNAIIGTLLVVLSRP